MDIIMKDKRGLELVTHPFSGFQICSFQLRFLSLVINHLYNFDILFNLKQFFELPKKLQLIACASDFMTS